MITATADFAPQLSYELDGITGRGEFLRAAAECVGALLPSDSLGWVAVDMRAQQVEIYGTGDSGRPDIVDRLARSVEAHPMLASYRDRPGDMTPRRMSDIIPLRAWRSHPVYTELFVPLGAVHQVTVMMRPFAGGSWAGWGFNRATRDFSDDEMSTAARIQPVLMALSHVSAHAFAGDRPVERATGEGERADLTAREVHVLRLLATGLTAQAIAHTCRISPRTVRKHLENSYEKLGCHDRLTAVRRAAALGLIGPA